MNRSAQYGTHRVALMTSLVALLLMFAAPPMAQATTAEIEVEDLLPRYRDYRWRVFGFAEYGHQMRVDSIRRLENAIVYDIEGKVDDMSSGEAEQDYTFSISYRVKPDVIIQEKEGEMLLDSDYHVIEIIRSPIVEGASWTQEVSAGEDDRTLQCTIESIEGESGERVVTVVYQADDDPYYERRELQENVGVVTFERSILEADEPYDVSYSIFWDRTGVFAKEQFADVQVDAWYARFLGPVERTGIIEGYPDGTFRAERNSSVAEFMKMVLSALGMHPDTEGTPWYASHRIRAEEFGLIIPGEFAQFDRPITRQEMGRMLARAVDSEASDLGILEQFSDADEVGAAFVDYLAEPVRHGFLHGYPDGTLRPRDPTNRAEAAKVASVLLNSLERPAHRPSDALSMEREFEERLIQDTFDDGEEPLERVRDFDRKQDLVDHLAEILEEDLAASYVADFYEERNEGLYLIPRDGPIFLHDDVEFTLEIVTPNRREVRQSHWSGLAGDYTLLITYGYVGGRWIMSEREVETSE